MVDGEQFASLGPPPLVVGMPLVDHWTSEDLGAPLLGIVYQILERLEGLTPVDFVIVARNSETIEIQHAIQLATYSYLFAGPLAAKSRE